MYKIKSLQVLQCNCSTIVATGDGYVSMTISSADDYSKVEAHLIDEETGEETLVSGYGFIAFKTATKGIFKSVVGGKINLSIVDADGGRDHYVLHVTDTVAQRAIISAFGMDEQIVLANLEE